MFIFLSKFVKFSDFVGLYLAINFGFKLPVKLLYFFFRGIDELKMKAEKFSDCVLSL